MHYRGVEMNLKTISDLRVHYPVHTRMMSGIEILSNVSPDKVEEYLKFELIDRIALREMIIEWIKSYSTWEIEEPIEDTLMKIFEITEEESK